MRFASLAAAAALVTLAACAPAAPPEIETRAPEANETRVEGMITQVEDGGYPQFTVHITPDGGAEPFTLYLNAEGADLGGTAPGEFAGKRAAVLYTAADEAMLADIRLNGQSLVPGAAAEPSGDNITGVLSGAEQVVGGDLPDVITVTDASGRALEFEYYITPELVPANGQQVTAYYTTHTRERITYMRAAP